MATSTTLDDSAVPHLVRAKGASLAEEARLLAGALSDLLQVVQFRDRDRLARYGVTSRQYHALKAVVSGALTVNDLSAHLLVDKSTASRIASGLIEKGFLARGAQPDDGRVVRFAGTPSGLSLLATLEADEERDYAVLLTDLDLGTPAEAHQLLTRLARSLASGVVAEGGSCSVVR